MKNFLLSLFVTFSFTQMCFSATNTYPTAIPINIEDTGGVSATELYDSYPLVVPTDCVNANCVTHPSVIYTEENIFAPYHYIAVYSGDPTYCSEDTYIAGSVDGKTWTSLIADNAPLFSTSELSQIGTRDTITYWSGGSLVTESIPWSQFWADPHIVMLTNKSLVAYSMAYNTIQDTNGCASAAFCAKTSVDGTNWSDLIILQKWLNNTNHGFGAPSMIIKDDGTLRMYAIVGAWPWATTNDTTTNKIYSTYHANASIFLYRDSIDNTGTNWPWSYSYIDTNNYIFWHADVKKVGNYYYAMSMNATVDWNRYGAFGTSSDGITWSWNTNLYVLPKATYGAGASGYYKVSLLPKAGYPLSFDVLAAGYPIQPYNKLMWIKNWVPPIKPYFAERRVYTGKVLIQPSINKNYYDVDFSGVDTNDVPFCLMLGSGQRISLYNEGAYGILHFGRDTKPAVGNQPAIVTQPSLWEGPLIYQGPGAMWLSSPWTNAPLIFRQNSQRVASFEASQAFSVGSSDLTGTNRSVGDIVVDKGIYTRKVNITDSLTEIAPAPPFSIKMGNNYVSVYSVAGPYGVLHMGTNRVATTNEQPFLALNPVEGAWISSPTNGWLVFRQNQYQFGCFTKGGSFHAGGRTFADDTNYSFGDITAEHRIDIFDNYGWYRTDPLMRAGSLVLQDRGWVSDSWIGDNVDFNGTSWTYHSNGFGHRVQFRGPEMYFTVFPTNTAGTTLPSFGNLMQMKINQDGTVALGGSVSITSGDYSGATIVANTSSVVISTNVTCAGSFNATNGFTVGSAVGLTTNINVIVAGNTTNQLQFTKGILTGVVPQ